MNVSPQDENKIIWMILRDTQNILARTRNFDFSYASKVKLQKVVFLIAEKLDIPLTRSWYRYGGYVHNTTVDFAQLSRLSFTLSPYKISEIRKIQHAFSDTYQEYYELLHELVPRVFFMPLEELLAEVYEGAPKEYRPLYFTNLAIENNFKLVKNYEKNTSEACQSTLFYHLSEKSEPNFSQYMKFANSFSKLALSIADLEDLCRFYDYADIYTSMLEDCLIKMDLLGKISLQHLYALKSVYEQAIWTPITLKISINTVTGLNADAVRLRQEHKLAKVEDLIRSQLLCLKQLLSKDKMLPTLDEKTKFFKSVYGKDKDFLGAISDVWKSYK